MGEVSDEFAGGLLLIWSHGMPLVSLSWRNISAEFNEHRVGLNYGGAFWRTMQLDGDVEVL